MNRRRCWRAGLASLLVLALPGCGFQLRSSQVFVFERIAINPPAGSALVNELVRYLGDRVVPIQASAGKPGPDVVFDILQEQRQKVVVGVNASGQVREFQLRIRVRFRLRTPQGRELIGETEIAQQRDISFNESAVLAKEAEEALLYKDMQSDTVQQLLRRLAAVKSIKPADPG
jgi:LPS-assembly lipoprotein